MNLLEFKDKLLYYRNFNAEEFIVLAAKQGLGKLQTLSVYKTINNLDLREAKRILDQHWNQYKIGTKFKIDGFTYILSSSGTHLFLVNLETRMCYNHPVSISGIGPYTYEDIMEVVGHSDWERI